MAATAYWYEKILTKNNSGSATKWVAQPPTVNGNASVPSGRFSTGRDVDYVRRQQTAMGNRSRSAAALLVGDDGVRRRRVSLLGEG